MGTLWHRSGTVERFADDLRATGAKAFFFSGGTTTPLTVYRDSLESSSFPHPVEADANGRWPDIFIPFIVSYDVRVTTAEGVQLTFSERVPNPDPIEQTVIIPPEERVQTGMIHAELINSTKPGYVRLNGRSIGSGASTADERNNDDTLNLFTYLWNNVPNTIAPVSGGRGASAGADFSANKTLTLPSMRGQTFIGLDTMGNVAAGAFAGLTFTVGDTNTPGSSLGANSVVLTEAQMPAHTHAGSTSTHSGHVHNFSTSAENAAHTHSWGGTFGTTGINGGSIAHQHSLNGGAGLLASGALGATSGPTGLIGGNVIAATDFSGTLDHSHNVSVGGTTGTQSANHAHTGTTDVGGSAHSHTFTTDSKGSSQAFNNLPFSRLVTWFIKL